MAQTKVSAANPWADVIIIGGGASGTLMAFHLLRHQAADLRVVLIEQRPHAGRGIAYGTVNPEHLLNVRADKMSGLPDEPEHFWSWLRAQPHDAMTGPRDKRDRSCFAPRIVYANYLASLLAPFTARGGRHDRLRIVHGECASIEEGPSSVTATLADGSRHVGEFAVLATGHETGGKSGGCYVSPWMEPQSAGVNRNARVLIVGTGLTMVDYVLSLERAGHIGPIVAMSRRGLLPRPHRLQRTLPIRAADIPFGAGCSQLLHWLRNLVTEHAAQGGDWRSVVDGLRPFNQQIWQMLPHAARRSFLRHARAWWNVHRHRMAPEVEARINAAIASGHLTVMAASLHATEPNDRGATIRYRRRGATRIESLQVDNIVECRGVVTNPLQTSNPCIRSLLDGGRARADVLRIGLDVAPNGALIDRAGTASERLFAVGPIARAALWEITAIPEICGQCAELAEDIKRTRLRLTG